jgi:hypothetical protein
MRTETREAARAADFRHEALFYAGAADFVDRISAFIEDSVVRREPILVVVGAEKIDQLRERLGGDPDGVRFADMAHVGQNPARIIPAWREFVAEQASSGRRFRGIGEPIWATRSASELVECERHEALLNLAFADAPAWWLACPYDTESLAPSVLEEAKRNHPHLVDGDRRRESETYRGLEAVARPFDEPLAEPSGSGVFRTWEEGSSLICEVSDTGRIDDPLVGRGNPSVDHGSGFGLWLANQLCDLVQIRSFTTGSVVRLHVGR